ncbi:Tryptophan synthase beta chain [compost metagenome]
MDKWLNVRSLVNADALDEIYRYEVFEDYYRFYPKTVVDHAMTNEKWIMIPEELKSLYQMVGRTTPLVRAYRLEKKLKTTNRIYLKREDLLCNGSFKITSALPQAYYGALQGKQKVITETGAGQTGVAAALAAQLNGMHCQVFMVRSSYQVKKLRRTQMEVYGAQVIPSPSEATSVGRSLLSKGEMNGSIANATSEVLEQIDQDQSSFNIAGSLFDFVLTYNTVIGLEVIQQLEKVKIHPDFVVGCVGGGSSFGGFALPLLDHYGHERTQYVCTESGSIPTLTQGTYDFDYPDGEGKSNRLLMYSLGYDFKPPSMHASGLRYHAASPLLSYFVHHGAIQPVAYDETLAMKSAIDFSRTEGIVASPESCYTIHAITELCKHHEDRNIIAMITGNGSLDLESYGHFL